MPILRRDRRLRTCGFGQILISSVEFGDGFENSISALPDPFTNRAGSAAARLHGVAVDQEAAAAEQVGADARLKPQGVWTMIRRVERRADDDPGALRDGADARDALHRGIILAVIESRVARPPGPSVPQQSAGFLGVGPHES